MANAGYGNHVTTDPKVGEKPSPGEAPPGAKDEGGRPRDGAPPPPSNDDARHVSTPGAGALPSDGAGDDVDPGAG